MKKTAAAVLFVLGIGSFSSSVLAAASSEQPGCLKEVCFALDKEIAGQKLPLHGVGDLQYLMLDMYTGAFYAPADVKTSADALADVPKALVLEYHRGIKVKWMNEAAEKILRKNPENDIKALQSRIDQIAAAYQKVSKGDRYELRYEPGTGTSLLLNDKLIVTIPGVDFARAYLGIWLSEYPANKKFRDKILGLSA